MFFNSPNNRDNTRDSFDICILSVLAMFLAILKHFLILNEVL